MNTSSNFDPQRGVVGVQSTGNDFAGQHDGLRLAAGR
jgi:hypothetical protein